MDALHAYVGIKAANAVCKALEAVEQDDKHESELGPTSRGTSTFDFCICERIQRPQPKSALM